MKRSRQSGQPFWRGHITNSRVEKSVLTFWVGIPVISFVFFPQSEGWNSKLWASLEFTVDRYHHTIMAVASMRQQFTIETIVNLVIWHSSTELRSGTQALISYQFKFMNNFRRFLKPLRMNFIVGWDLGRQSSSTETVVYYAKSWGEKKCALIEPVTRFQKFILPAYVHCSFLWLAVRDKRCSFCKYTAPN